MSSQSIVRVAEGSEAHERLSARVRDVMSAMHVAQIEPCTGPSLATALA